MIIHYQEINVVVHDYFLKNRSWNIDFLGLSDFGEWNFKLVKVSKTCLKTFLTNLSLTNIDLLRDLKTYSKDIKGTIMYCTVNTENY